ncbi:hypothetical protein HLH34_10210 [Gluconacetobacter azotocaptans]|uniref:Uncharacterized protein n=1 Tax=Gluconacetobacter azotocaptans TaxID=142834 RepID=A0A7W4JSZ8_9PROT|nr:hypothetical protein [Gluconacetobacter azotocaptans]MBB2190330.1 hypothetical protein [Gluconacetobacter azotocaptans]GBQ27524.1 hypothetical protein AA13594_0629 [Gluconacetobacter azotocaptans DSM 13594]
MIRGCNVAIAARASRLDLMDSTSALSPDAMKVLYGIDTGIRLDRQQWASDRLAEIMDFPVSPLKPMVGAQRKITGLRHCRPGAADAALSLARQCGKRATSCAATGLDPTPLGALAQAPARVAAQQKKLAGQLAQR